MAKSKNHTAHNQSYKAHKNGIKKPKKHKYTSRKGVYHLSLHEIRFAMQLVAQNLIRKYVSIEQEQTIFPYHQYVRDGNGIQITSLYASFL
jgi:large subunit ribosomal protein L29e